MPRRLALMATAVAACLAAALTGATTALADPAQPPLVSSISPLVVVPNGQPQRLIITGFNFATVNQVFLSPVVLEKSFSVAGDTVMTLTVPANIAPGSYSVEVVSPAGSSSPGSVEFTVGNAPATETAPAPATNTAPQQSFAPIPAINPLTEPTTGVLTPGASVEYSTPPGSPPLNPLLLLPLGFVFGGICYLLWGRPGRLATAEDQGLRAQLIGRPAQALRIGRICLQCHRLHYVFATRRDLWRAGHFCSASCFVASEEADTAARAGESTAATRMREMFVYSELEGSLQAALAAERGKEPDAVRFDETAAQVAPPEETLVEAG